MNERSFQKKKEIWEEESFAIDASEDCPPSQAQSLSQSITDIEPATEEIKEELKAQEPSNIFISGLEDGDPEMATDSVTMSELDEINPPDAISYNPKFFEAAHEFMEVVICQSSVPKKGRAFTEYLQTCFVNVRNASQPEFEQINRVTEQLNKDGANEREVPRSSKFCLFADDLIKRCTDEQTMNKLMMEDKTTAIYQAIFKKFLAKTYAEANYLLQQMSIVCKQADPENEFEVSELHETNLTDNRATGMGMSEIHAQQVRKDQQSMSHLLLDISRQRQ